MRNLILVFVVFLILVFELNATVNYVQYVDPRIGTKLQNTANGAASGFTYIGATYPFGMIQFTPTYFSPGLGFLVNQLSGAGCPHMGNFPTQAFGGTFCGHYADTKYRVYFAAEFNKKSSKSGTWKENDVVENQLTVGGGESGAYFTFDTKEENIVEYRIAISYISVDNARENLLKDNNKGEFSELIKAAWDEWNRRLGIIEIKSQNTDRLIQFYTHLYHVLIHPNVFNDINGEYIGSDYKVHTVEKGREYNTSFSGWDTYRTQCQYFEDITLHLLKGDLQISGGDTKSYIRTMKLNGKQYNSSWINWSDIDSGCKIEYELTSDNKPRWAVNAVLPSID
jgi:putative alpha-1,2-mannosidase